jgi:hypothetical protein
MKKQTKSTSVMNITELKDLVDHYKDLLNRIYIARNIALDPKAEVWAEVDREFRTYDPH